MGSSWVGAGQDVLEVAYGAVQVGDLLAQPADVAGRGEVDPVQRVPGGPLDPPLHLGPGPQQQPGDVGERLRLDRVLQPAAHRALDRVVDLTPQRLARHRASLRRPGCSGTTLPPRPRAA
jgi:hypothetical protein